MASPRSAAWDPGRKNQRDSNKTTPSLHGLCKVGDWKTRFGRRRYAQGTRNARNSCKLTIFWEPAGSSLGTGKRQTTAACRDSGSRAGLCDSALGRIGMSR
ncbi:hypothetical protein ACRE_079950 [Hapsidospora chrysogenum ATCC 11550]|uniref:Uncharacterized protein n=1 Tax=Hapsidospora chrysogenum (strain ATCC 11550 / CBS 779.69 / DSM 880 / IAM 14645 / JCM 23072 / IMI 49137) TaxID=857340 RepID=A0A086SW16_HAPC1|nr:hypothetical protein ACRE_079950 [Hapsidospora chrysogenum ATCC 11550]